jgi:uncharacterized protein DUF6152
MRKMIIAALGALLVSVPLLAHHGAAALDTGKEITLKGTVTEWIWSNPHCFLQFDAKDDTGTVRNWAVETQNPTAMTQRGWSRTSFKAGDEVTVILEPVKNSQPIGRLLTVVLPNGQKLIAAPPTTPATAP